MSKHAAIERAGLAITFILICASIYLIFMVVPNERVMGAVQRIFYFHVGSAIAAYCAIGLVLICSLGYIATRDLRYDAVLTAASEVGFLFCTIVLASGMIWGKAAWNTWFRWEPRLVSFVILWLIFFASLVLRHFGEQTKIAGQAAVLGILGAVNVPLVIYSVKLLPQSAQLHPEVVEKQGLKDPSFVQTMLLAMFAIVLLQFLLVWIRARVEFQSRAVDKAWIEHEYT